MADLDLDRFMRGLARRNPGEREFHQAVREVVGSLIPFLRVQHLLLDHTEVRDRRDPGTDDRTRPHHHLQRLLARGRQQHPDEPRLPLHRELLRCARVAQLDRAGRAPASTAAPAPSRCAAPQPATSPTLFGSPRHETARLRAPDERGPPRRHPGRRRPDRGDDTAPGTGSPDASHTRWSGRSATRGRPAARHTPDGWRSTGRHSSRRPPPGQRAAGLQLVHLRIQQLGLHQQLADLGLQPTMVFVPGIRRAAL